MADSQERGDVESHLACIPRVSTPVQEPCHLQTQNIPFGPLICAAWVGISFPWPRFKVLGRSSRVNDTSGGTEMAAPPTRDCAGLVVEKHCTRAGENAGVRKRGNELRWKCSRMSCRAQRWGRNDMMFGVLDGASLRSSMILSAEMPGPIGLAFT